MKTLGGKGGFGMTKGWFLRGSSIFCSQVESQVNKVRWRKSVRDITEAENQGQAVHSLSDINPIIVFSYGSLDTQLIFQVVLVLGALQVCMVLCH